MYPAAFITHIYDALRISDLSRVVQSHFTLLRVRVCHSRARVRKARDFARRFISVCTNVAASSCFATASALCSFVRSRRRIRTNEVAPAQLRSTITLICAIVAQHRAHTIAKVSCHG